MQHTIKGRVKNMTAPFATAGGTLLADVAVPDDSDVVHALYNSGLAYEYAGRTQLEQDFAKGLFRPCFEDLP